MQTSNDALITKIYAEKLGYFKDEFVSLFTNKRQAKKMYPIINRGTWARVYTVRQILLRFLAANSGKVNVLSLGAGFDSTYFWLRKKLGEDKTTADHINWLEVDFHDVVKQKHDFIKDKEKLSSLVGAFTFVDNDLVADGYKVFTCDVRDGHILKQKFDACKVDRTLPTLLVTECLMIYMTGSESTGVYNWIRDYFTGDFVSVNYEMINPDDAFGKMMVTNLEERGCQLLGIVDCPNVEAQIKRMQAILSTGEASRLKIECLPLNTIYNTKLNGEGEKTRIERIELFDEFEEWELL